MSDSKAPAIRARLRYASIAEFKAGYSKFVSTGGMFIPVPEEKLKPVGSDIRFQFMLNNGDTVLLGKGTVLQVRRPDAKTPNSPIGILVKFSKLSQDSKKIIDEIVAEKDNQKVPTQEVLVEEEDLEERENYPTPAAVEAVAKNVTDISEDQTVVGTLDDIFRSQNNSLEEQTPTPDQGEAKEEPASLGGISTEAKVEPDDLIFQGAEPEAIPIEKKTASNIRVLSYDDMSAVDAEKVDFGFSGEESEIDDMFDDLFGKSGDNSFFDDILGGDASSAEVAEPSPVAETAPVKSVEAISKPVVETLPSVDSLIDEESPEPIVEVSQEEAELPVFTLPDSVEKDEADDELFAAADEVDEEPFVAPIEEQPEADDELFATLEPFEEEDSEPELVLEDPVFNPEPILPASSVPSPGPDDSLSMEDAFESEPEDESFNDELNAAPDVFLGDRASDPLERINEIYGSDEEEDENPFRPDPPSIEMDVDLELDLDAPVANQEDPTLALSADSFKAITDDKPALPQIGDLFEESETSVVEFDVEPDESEPVFDAFDASEASEANDTSAPSIPPAFVPNISRDGELDGLLGELETDAPVGRSFDLNHEDDLAPPEELNEDSDSLEALLALANKDIESKKEEEKDDIDILDQLLGDEDLPPLPDVDNSFKMPTPETSGKKKGLFSKLFGKD